MAEEIPPAVSKTIALADPRWRGHHPTYFFEFSTALLELGHRIIALCANPEAYRAGMEEIAERLGVSLEERLTIVSLQEPSDSMIPGLEHDPLTALRRWKRLKVALAQGEKDSGWEADLVFLSYLDAYLRFQMTTKLPESLPRPWAGLYFRNHHFSRPSSKLYSMLKGDVSLASKNCVGVGVLDERFCEPMKEASGSEIVVFPDITNETEPKVPTAQALKIIEQANGRKIVGTIGTEKRKGTLTLLKIAVEASQSSDLFFVVVGPYAEGTFSEEEKAFLADIHQKSVSGELSNLYFEFPGGRINDGNDFNSLIKTFDVIYAAYEGFEGSSNALTKAGVFERTIVATEGECIGDRVEKFGLGCTFSEGDVTAGLQAIEEVVRGVGNDGKPLKKNFADYRARHGRKRLQEVFSEMIGRVK